TTASAPPEGRQVPGTAGGEPTATRIVTTTPDYLNDPSLGTDSPAPTATIAGRS
ncbi:MAG: hypothetical protein QOK35_3739, partial [Pseudonocardiales bacterium]|nr:hypothetical protein [Pseudonocardiales bacterium]